MLFFGTYFCLTILKWISYLQLDFIKFRITFKFLGNPTNNIFEIVPWLEKGKDIYIRILKINSGEKKMHKIT